MSKQESEQIAEIFQYILDKKKVVEKELINKFGKNTLNLMKKGLSNLRSLGLNIFSFKDENSETVYVVGIDKPSEKLDLKFDKQVLAVFLLVSYFIFKQEPKQRAIWDEITVIFEKFLKEIDFLISQLHWLNKSSDGYLFIDPIGKFVLVNFLPKNKDTGNRKLVDLIESYIK